MNPTAANTSIFRPKASAVERIFGRSRAVIVASALKGGSWWNPVDPARLEAFMRVVERARG